MIIRNSLITASMRMGDDHLLLQYPEGWWAPDQMRNGAINALPKNRGNWELTRLKKKKQTLLCWSGELICLDSQNTLKNVYLIRTYYIIDFNTLLPIRLHGCTLELAAGIWCSALELGTCHIYMYISQYPNITSCRPQACSLTARKANIAPSLPAHCVQALKTSGSVPIFQLFAPTFVHIFYIYTYKCYKYDYLHIYIYI